MKTLFTMALASVWGTAAFGVGVESATPVDTAEPTKIEISRDEKTDAQELDQVFSGTSAPKKIESVDLPTTSQQDGEESPALTKRVAQLEAELAKLRAQATSDFDAVPPSQIANLQKRLDLIQVLITQYGRAYDYRTLTTVELQAKLDELSRKAR